MIKKKKRTEYWSLWNTHLLCFLLWIFIPYTGHTGSYKPNYPQLTPLSSSSQRFYNVHVHLHCSTSEDKKTIQFWWLYLCSHTSCLMNYEESCPLTKRSTAFSACHPSRAPMPSPVPSTTCPSPPHSTASLTSRQTRATSKARQYFTNLLVPFL